jgi:peptidoglycan/LPS O-acetylase OafA/YrhL
MQSPGAPENFHNNFDLLRFILASVVFLFHLPTLSGLTAFGRLATYADGTVAVLGFFAISGYVVSLSYSRSATWKDYATRRARRLLPGYFAVVTICFLGGALISVLSIPAYFANTGTWKYLAANFTFVQFLQPDLPGVFANNPVLHAVNGSLWSIRTEVFCYVLLPFCLTLRLRLPALILFGGLSMFVSDTVLKVGIFHPVVSFVIGMWIVTWRGPILRWLGLFGALLLITVQINPVAFHAAAIWDSPLMPASVACAILAAALELPYLGDWAFLGDLSYGVYLWHFPLIQFTISKGWLEPHPYLRSLFLAAAVLVAAAASWRLVESRFVRSHGAAKQHLPANEPLSI